MKYMILTLCLLLAFTMLFGEVHNNAGQFGYKFLNVPYGPVSLALAGRGVHSPNNPGAFILQPAASCEADQRIIGASHNAWLVDTQANCLAYSYARRTDHFGVAVRNLDYGDIENRDDTGYLIGYYNPVDVDLLLNYAYRISPSFYFGISGGVLYQKLNTATSMGLHGDFGFSVLPPFKGSKLSLAVRNVGNATYTNQEKVRFPSSMEADYTHSLKLGEQQLTLGASAIKMMDEDPKGSVSAELMLMKLLSLRGGMKLNYAAESYTAGFGVHYRKIGVDYGFAAFDNELTDVHSFGLSYRF